MREYIIGVDIGTQRTKAVVYDIRGNQVSSAFEASELVYLEDGGITEDPEKIFGSVLRTVKAAVERGRICANEAAAIGIDSQMAGLMAVDENWNPVLYYDSWLDTRCTPFIREMKRTAGDRIIGITGGQVTCVHGPKLLWWREKEREAYRRVCKFLQPCAYAAGRLCGLSGERAFIDDTFLHFTSFADNEKREWSEELTALFDIEREKLPEIRRPSEVIGCLTSEMAWECGLDEETKVIAGCGDSAASSLGAGIVRPGMIYDIAGTASVFSAAADRFAPDVEHKTILYARSAVEGMWIPLAYMSGGGLCIRWAAELFGRTYEELDRLAETVPWGCGGLLFNPHFAGMTCPNRPEVKGGWKGLSWKHSQGHLYRSILESIVYEYGGYLDILKEHIPDLEPEGIYGVGGGTNSDLFNQMKADALGYPYYTLRIEEAATWGSAVLAGIGAGLFEDARIAGRGQKIKKSYPARKEINCVFRENKLRYMKMQQTETGA